MSGDCAACGAPRGVAHSDSCTAAARRDADMRRATETVLEGVLGSIERGWRPTAVHVARNKDGSGQTYTIRLERPR